jgi:CRISPR-associated exonuclease Cas4
LIHLEQAWAENKFTAEGLVLHENAHEGADETRDGVRITRGMPVVSQALGLTGKCDVVEFAACGSDSKFEISHLRGRDADAATERPGGNIKSQISNFKFALRVVPVEYKRGKPKAHRADEVQLCAQALCLEEMLGIGIPAGALYYGEKRRRTEVVFDEALRELVRATTTEIRECFASCHTPIAEYEPRRCDACSLIDFCQPLALRFKKGAAAWFSANLKSEISMLKSTKP